MTRQADAPLRAHLGYNLKRAWLAVQADLIAVLRPFDLRILSYSALVVVVQRPGIRPAELATALAVERSNLVGVIDGLEVRGLLQRARDTQDRRAIALHASDRGRDLCARASAAVQAHERKLEPVIAPARLAALAQDLNRIEQVFGASA